MYSTIIFLSIFIVVLSLMLIIDIQGHCDTSTKELLLVIRLYKIKIVTIRLNFNGLFYKTSVSKKFKTLNLILTKKQKYFIKQIKLSVLDKLYYDKINVDYLLYLPSPGVTANVVGFVTGITATTQTIMNLKNIDTEFNVCGNANFINSTSQVNIAIRVYFTIFDMLFAVIMSLYKRGKYGKAR